MGGCACGLLVCFWLGLGSKRDVFVLRALERDQRAGFIRRDYTKPRGFGMCQTFRRIPGVESPAGTGTGKPRRVTRPRALAMAAERTKSRGEEAKTRAVAESTSITTVIARVLHPTHLHAETNTTTASRSPVVTRPRTRATATTTTAVATATGASTARRIATAARVFLHRRSKTRHYPLSCSHHHHHFQTAQTAPLGPVCRE